MYAIADNLGIIVLDGDLNLLASNPHAVHILTFPNSPNRIPDLHNWLSTRIQDSLLPQLGATNGVVARFKSANRTYACHSFAIHVQIDVSSPALPAQVILLQRTSELPTTLEEIAKQFSLTPREVETVKLLVRGLTSKEIGEHMKISTNTVKAFIRQVMVKTKTSTRSGIIGKIADRQNVTLTAFAARRDVRRREEDSRD